MHELELCSSHLSCSACASQCCSLLCLTGQQNHWIRDLWRSCHRRKTETGSTLNHNLHLHSSKKFFVSHWRFGHNSSPTFRTVTALTSQTHTFQTPLKIPSLHKLPQPAGVILLGVITLMFVLQNNPTNSMNWSEEESRCSKARRKGLCLCTLSSIFSDCPLGFFLFKIYREENWTEKLQRQAGAPSPTHPRGN